MRTARRGTFRGDRTKRGTAKVGTRLTSVRHVKPGTKGARFEGRTDMLGAATQTRAEGAEGELRFACYTDASLESGRRWWSIHRR